MVGVYAMQVAGSGALKLAPSSNSRHACRTTSGAAVAPRRPNYVTAPAYPAYRRKVTTMGNKGENGPFAPLVRAVRGVMGTKEFNKFRGQMISLHSQVIKDFGKQIGVDIKQVQGLIRLAKKNGEKLGFLA